jgi:hypothetical protein
MTAEQLSGRRDEIIALKLPAVQAPAQALSSLENAVIVIAGTRSDHRSSGDRHPGRRGAAAG